MKKNKINQNSILKIYSIRHALEEERLNINKSMKYFSLPDHQLAKNFIPVFCFYQKK